MKSALLAGLLMIMLSLSRSSLGAGDGLVAHYGFTEGYGAIVHDSSAVKNDAKIVGATWVKAGGSAALDLDGPEEYVDCGDAPAGRVTGPLTLAVWVRTIARQEQALIDRVGWGIYLDEKGVPVFRTRTPEDPNNHDYVGWDNLAAKDAVPLNEWTQVVAVYDTDREVMEIFINGTLSASKPCKGVIATSAGDTSLGRIGGLRRAKMYLGKGLVGMIGGFRLYNRALSAAEVKQMCAESAPDASLKPMQYRVRVTPHFFFDQKKVDAQISISSLRNPSGVRNLDVSLLRAGGKQPVARQVLANPGSTTNLSAVFSLAGLQRGEYEIRVSAKDESGKELAASSGMVTYPKDPWWYNSKAGISNKVLPPWTPLKLKQSPAGGNTQIECLGRTYTFGAGPLPEQITSLNRRMLAEPVRFSTSANGSTVSWQADPVNVEKESPDTIAFSRKFRGSDIDLSIKSTIEYDGMMRFDCVLTPKKNVALDRFVLEIPLEARYANLQYQYRDPLFKASGAVPEAGFARVWNPAIWLGNEEVGLQWFAESDENWHPADPNRAIEIVRDGNKTVLRLNMVTKPLELAQAGKLAYTFGLQATPVKTFEKDGWDYRPAFALGYGKEYEMLDAKWKEEPLLDFYQKHSVKTITLFNWTDVLSYPGVVGPHQKQLKDLVKACHKRGMQVLLYLGNQYSELAPEFAGFKEDFVNWGDGRRYSYSTYPDNYPPMRAQLVFFNCSGSRWSEFIVAGCEKMMDEYDVDGFYLDGVACPILCYNREHGCGYTKPDGSTERSYAVWEARDLIRRIYTLVKTRKPEGQVDLHNGSYMISTTVAWATTRWDGETILGEDRRGYSPKPGDFLLDFLPLAEFRAQFMGKQWGVPAELLDYYTPYPLMRQFSISLLHDVIVRASSPEYVEAVYPLQQALDRFGRKEAQWLPYWKNGSYVSAGPEGAYVSLYKHPKNGVLAVISNLCRDTASVKVNFDLGRLGLPAGVKASDALTGKILNMENGSISMELDSVDWKLVRLSP